jgi:hypothetical protein
MDIEHVHTVLLRSYSSRELVTCPPQPAKGKVTANPARLETVLFAFGFLPVA